MCRAAGLHRSDGSGIHVHVSGGRVIDRLEGKDYTQGKRCSGYWIIRLTGCVSFAGLNGRHTEMVLNCS
jgi:hypothetical protein